MCVWTPQNIIKINELKNILINIQTCYSARGILLLTFQTLPIKKRTTERKSKFVWTPHNLWRSINLKFDDTFVCLLRICGPSKLILIFGSLINRDYYYYYFIINEWTALDDIRSNMVLAQTEIRTREFQRRKMRLFLQFFLLLSFFV